MKKIVLVTLCAILLVVACKHKEEENSAFAKAETKIRTLITAEAEETGIIYEANIRQYSTEGTFDAFTKDIPVLKELGVNIIWVMPIFPISETKRKGGLGSYYAVSDFRAINPEFGNLEDVDELITTAHDNGMYVILDWVPNHTGWDHTWIKEHPEWYTKDAKGNITDPLNPETGAPFGWTDVADLDYTNKDMRSQMIADLKYWVEEHDVDGFRMDVAHKVPVEFFANTIDTLEKIKPLFMLAEAEQPDLMAHGFDMHYAWEMHHLLNAMAKNEKTVEDFWTLLTKYDQTLAADDINMYFVTNHDENSWAGTLEERMPESKELFTTLTYMLPGMPLLYSGQEYDLDHRLAFFEKDSIPKDKGGYFELLKKLGTLKNENVALHGGKNKAQLIKIDQKDPSILSFAREKDGKQLIFVGNFSADLVKISLGLEANFTDVLAENGNLLNGKDAIGLGAWEFKIIEPESKIDFELPIVPNIENE